MTTPTGYVRACLSICLKYFGRTKITSRLAPGLHGPVAAVRMPVRRGGASHRLLFMDESGLEAYLLRRPIPNGFRSRRHFRVIPARILRGISGTFEGIWSTSIVFWMCLSKSPLYPDFRP